MSTADPNDWRTWPREGIVLHVPDGAPQEQRLAALWTTACEEFGAGPGTMPPSPRNGRIGIIRRSAP
jgi:hypothetical protein